jgi:hypothetical protein
VRVGSTAVGLIELSDECGQVVTAEPAIESVSSRAGQQVSGCAVAVEVDPTDERTERRRARIGEVRTQLKTIL